MDDEPKYKLDFNEMYMSKEMTGVYWESVPENIRFYDHIIKHIERMRKDKTQMYLPILYINSLLKNTLHKSFIFLKNTLLIQKKDLLDGVISQKKPY